MTTATAARTASRYIPRDSQPVTRDGFDCIVYLYPFGNKFGAIAYRGTRGRHSFNYTFRTEQIRAAYVDKFFNDQQGLQDYRNSLKAGKDAAKKAGHGAHIGQVFYTSWGYDQTNIDFYEVVKVSPASIVVRQIKQTTRETGFMSGQNYALPGQFCGEEKRCIFTGSGFKFDRHHMSPWDGQPKTSSWYA